MAETVTAMTMPWRQEKEDRGHPERARTIGNGLCGVERLERWIAEVDATRLALAKARASLAAATAQQEADLEWGRALLDELKRDRADEDSCPIGERVIALEGDGIRWDEPVYDTYWYTAAYVNARIAKARASLAEAGNERMNSAVTSLDEDCERLSAALADAEAERDGNRNTLDLVRDDLQQRLGIDDAQLDHMGLAGAIERLADAARDTERMDWLQAQTEPITLGAGGYRYYMHLGRKVFGNCESIRAAIDAFKAAASHRGEE